LCPKLVTDFKILVHRQSRQRANMRENSVYLLLPRIRFSFRSTNLSHVKVLEPNLHFTPKCYVNRESVCTGGLTPCVVYTADITTRYTRGYASVSPADTGMMMGQVKGTPGRGRREFQGIHVQLYGLRESAACECHAPKREDFHSRAKCSQQTHECVLSLPILWVQISAV